MVRRTMAGRPAGTARTPFIRVNRAPATISPSPHAKVIERPLVKTGFGIDKRTITDEADRANRCTPAEALRRDDRQSQ